jgi:regulation of enolase protein 1 (concanavalin A-like superfamily)
MQWFNEPARWKLEKNAMQVSSNPHTDFWRLTDCGEIHDNGHFYFETIQGDFTAEARLHGDYHDLYDQSGLMLRQNEQCWMKCGIEYVEGVWHVSAVVTRGWSDWSMIALPGRVPVSIRVVRKGSSCEVYYATGDNDYTMYRQAYLTDVDTLHVGLMAASPTGNGFTAQFENFILQALN